MKSLYYCLLIPLLSACGATPDQSSVKTFQLDTDRFTASFSTTMYLPVKPTGPLSRLKTLGDKDGFFRVKEKAVATAIDKLFSSDESSIHYAIDTILAFSSTQLSREGITHPTLGIKEWGFTHNRNAPFLKLNDQYLAPISISLKNIPILREHRYKTMGLEKHVFLPIIVDLKSLPSRFRPCVAPDINKKTMDFEMLRWFFDPTACDFSRLNHSPKLFDKVSFKLKPSTVLDGGAPEYNRIWEDKHFYGIFQFSNYHSTTNSDFYRDHSLKEDPGYIAFKRFLGALLLRHTSTDHYQIKSWKKLHDEKDLEIVEVKFQFNRRGKQSKLDIPLDGTLRVIWSFSPITSGSSKDRKEKAFPRQQTRKLDLFSYNGHCGIGTNIKEIDSLLNTEETQYSILHLNACHTYRHMPSISPKYDLILNLSKAWFTHMSVSALAVLEGVILTSTVGPRNLPLRPPKLQ